MMAEPPAVVAGEHPGMEMEWLQPFGLAVRGVDPRSLSEESSSYFEAVMAVHGLVLFRGLGTLSADDQLAASSRFGTGIPRPAAPARGCELENVCAGARHMCRLGETEKGSARPLPTPTCARSP